MNSFEIVFGHPVSTGFSKPSICGVSEHYGNLCEQFDIMTSYIHELTSILEAYHQQAKEMWPLSTDKPYYLFRPGGQMNIKIFRRKQYLSPQWEGPHEVLLTTYTAIKIKKGPLGSTQAIAKQTQIVITL